MISSLIMYYDTKKLYIFLHMDQLLAMLVNKHCRSHSANTGSWCFPKSANELLRRALQSIPQELAPCLRGFRDQPAVIVSCGTHQWSPDPRNIGFYHLPLLLRIQPPVRPVRPSDACGHSGSVLPPQAPYLMSSHWSMPFKMHFKSYWQCIGSQRSILEKLAKAHLDAFHKAALKCLSPSSHSHSRQPSSISQRQLAISLQLCDLISASDPALGALQTVELIVLIPQLLTFGSEATFF